MSDLGSRVRRRIKHQMADKRPTIWLGKNRDTPELAREISQQLKKNGIVKIKVLKAALGEEKVGAIASRVAQQTGSSLVEVRGHTFTLFKPKER